MSNAYRDPDQLTHEVAVALCAGLATSPTRRGTGWDRERPVAHEKPLAPEHLQQRGPLLGEPSEDGGHVNLVQEEAELGAGFVEVERSPDDHDHAGLESRPPAETETSRHRLPADVRQHFTFSTGVCRSRVPSGSTRSM